MGEPAQWTCTAEGSLQWRTHPKGISSPFRILYRDPRDYLLPELCLGLTGPIMTKVTRISGTEYVSVARVNRMESSLDGTKLRCASSDNAFGAPEATVNLTVTGNKDPFIQQGCRDTLIWGPREEANHISNKVFNVPLPVALV